MQAENPVREKPRLREKQIPHKMYWSHKLLLILGIMMLMQSVITSAMDSEEDDAQVETVDEEGTGI